MSAEEQQEQLLTALYDAGLIAHRPVSKKFAVEMATFHKRTDSASSNESDAEELEACSELVVQMQAIPKDAESEGSEASPPTIPEVKADDAPEVSLSLPASPSEHKRSPKRMENVSGLGLSDGTHEVKYPPLKAAAPVLAACAYVPSAVEVVANEYAGKIFDLLGKEGFSPAKIQKLFEAQFDKAAQSLKQSADAKQFNELCNFEADASRLKCFSR
jgi:hypothetical protein